MSAPATMPLDSSQRAEIGGLTATIVANVAALRFEKLPSEAVTRAKAAIIDTVGCVLAGVDARSILPLREHVAREGGIGEAQVLGTSLRAPIGSAAFLNAAAGHSLDFDDVSSTMLGHPSVVIVPAILAAGEANRVAGRDLICAYVAGFEVAAGLGRLVNPAHYARGWHSTSTLGALAAAAAVGRLLSLDVPVLCRALGIAASQSSGLRRNFGTDVKPFHAGMAARAGLVSAALARSGLSASNGILEGPGGFVATLCEEDAGLDPEDLCSCRGNDLEMLRSGITTKVHACCATTHTAIDALLQLIAEHCLTFDEVVAVDCYVNAFAPGILIQHGPGTPLEGKFSMEYCLAVALADGSCGLAQFTPERFSDPALHRFIEHVRVTVDPELPTSVGGLTAARVVLHCTDGRRLSKRIDNPIGSPSFPLSQEAIGGKFVECAAAALGTRRAADVLDALQRLDTVEDVATITALKGPQCRRQVLPGAK